MDQIIEKIENILKLMGFQEFKVTIDEEHHKMAISINDELIHNQTAVFLIAFDHVVNLLLRKEDKPSYIVDVNHYRKERERLIAELARAAAKKAIITKTEVRLPPMNAYERRLVHMEITTHPDLTTESIGEGKDRCVVIKKVE